MKKIGILTFHYVDNYGAAVQAYSLMKAINSLKDCEASIIHYYPNGYTYYAYENHEEGMELFREKRNRFHSFFENSCNLKWDKKIELDEIESEYDFVCVGSDQVWNTELRENKELGYFLPCIINRGMCFSYAASIGMKPEDIDTDLFKKYLKDFKGISLREIGGYDKVFNDKVGKKVTKVLDPSLLVEREKLDELIPKKELYQGKFVFFFWYMLDDKLFKVIEFVNSLSRKCGLPIVHNIVTEHRYMLTNNGGCMYYSGVEDFLWYVRNAEYVVTNSFHGLALSLRFEKNFYLHVSNIRRQRMDELIEELAIKDRVINEFLLPSEINQNIDYKKINTKLEKLRMASMDFIKDMIYE